MIAIIGAGPIGSYAAYLLVKQGLKVQVYEKNKQIGLPVQCTGIVSSAFSKVISPDKSYVINKISKTRIYAPNNKHVSLNLKPNLIIDRTKFDRFLTKKAKQAGAEFYLNSKFIEYNGKHAIIEQNNTTKKISPDILIGADGPNSQVNKTCIKNKPMFFVGAQARVYLENDNAVEFYPGVGDFAWVVPETNKIARIGLVTRKNANLKEFLSKRVGKNYKSKVIDYQGGLIPLYNQKNKTAHNNVYLVGDAAGMVKATTAGGIIQGLIGAKALTESIIENKDYEKLWRKKLHKDLKTSLIIRKMLDQFSDKDYNDLIRLFNKKSFKKVLQENDRDNALSLIINLGLASLKHPSAFKFAKFIRFG
ncbi:MAG: Digeranylgeranylglycerophospholipid reductase [Candidatus Woesearchaeota archaeon]|nr:Digeranylgeranylglycerophospholipid reductase [Candidatus Woesearchaeota archaeon]